MRWFGWLLLVLMAGCGALPQPYFGNPGSTGALLAQPPPGRLAVLVPAQSLLTDEASQQWASAVAEALVEQELPAEARRQAGAQDWVLELTAETRGGSVVPSYTVKNPAGVSQGVTEGAVVPAAAWAAGQTATLKAAAAQAAPGIAGLLARIDAARRDSDPTSLQNRPVRVFVSGVSGAVGDGNRSLATQIRLKLQNQGYVVQDTITNADFEIAAKVGLAPGSPGNVIVDLQWTVSDSRGERGKVVQINEVPRRFIDPYWGDVAVAAATEAAGGIRSVIDNAGAKRAAPAPPQP